MILCRIVGKIIFLLEIGLSLWYSLHKWVVVEIDFQELEKVKNFDWDEWRKNFLKHNNNKKSRVTDLLRKLDEDGDGNLTR